MKIAICDDEKILLSNLKSIIYDYSNLHNWESVVYTYENGKDLIESNIKFDIIILDYQMDNLNGLETAKLLRTGKNKESCIIFLTSFPEIAIPAYEVDTYRFVVKKPPYVDLYNALDDFRKIVKDDYDISIKCNHEFITINTANITFIEVQNKYCYIHLKDDNILSTKIPLIELYSKLPHTHFFKIHKSFIVNFNYIKQRGASFVKIEYCDNELPVSRNYLSEFKTRYYNYLKGNS